MEVSGQLQAPDALPRGRCPWYISGRTLGEPESPPCRAEVKKVWGQTTIPPYVFVAWCLIRYKIGLHGVVYN